MYAGSVGEGRTGGNPRDGVHTTSSFGAHAVRYGRCTALHALHEDAVELRLRMALADAFEYLFGGCRELSRIADVERHTARVGLVQNVPRENFGDDRKADRRLLRRIGDDFGLRGRNAERTEHPAGIVFVDGFARH